MKDAGAIEQDHHGPINDGRGLAAYAVISFVSDHADDLPPWAFRRIADAFPDGGLGSFPVFPRKVFGKQDHHAFFVDVGPGVIAAGDQRGSDGLEEAWGDELEAAQGRKLALGIHAVFGVQAHRAGQYQALDVAADGHQLIGGVACPTRATSCSMSGPSSSSAVTKWAVAPMSFTPRS